MSSQAAHDMLKGKGDETTQEQLDREALERIFLLPESAHAQEAAPPAAVQPN